MLIDRVRQLGEEVEHAWGSADHAIDALAPIAARSIERFALHEHFELDEVGDWLSATGESGGAARSDLEIWQSGHHTLAELAVADRHLFLDRPGDLAS